MPRAAGEGNSTFFSQKNTKMKNNEKSNKVGFVFD